MLPDEVWQSSGALSAFASRGSALGTTNWRHTQRPRFLSRTNRTFRARLHELVGVREDRRFLSGPLDRLSRRSPYCIPTLKRQRTRLSPESLTAARGTSNRSSRSNRRRASRTRWSSSTRDTLRFHRSAFGMAPSIMRACPRPQPEAGAALNIVLSSPPRCEPGHISSFFSAASAPVLYVIIGRRGHGLHIDGYAGLISKPSGLATVTQLIATVLGSKLVTELNETSNSNICGTCLVLYVMHREDLRQ